MTEIRKVQITGGSSYIISLPKEWAKGHKIKKNDPLAISVQPDGNLLISPRISREQVQRVKELDLSGIRDATALFRLLIAAYIDGFTVIRIRGERRLPPFVRRAVRDFTQMTIGQEVAEETDQSITIKDLLNPLEMPFDRTLSRMVVIVRSMHEDAIGALETGNAALAQDVVSRDNDVDRLHWLVARQFNLVLIDPTLSRNMNLTLPMAASYFTMSRIVERIGDHAVRIAENVPVLLSVKVEKGLVADLKEATTLALELLRKSTDAFFADDIDAAHTTLTAIAALEERCSRIAHRASPLKGETAVALGYVIGSIQRIGEYSADICENTINHLVAEPRGG
ncbi:MAG: phosphate uptake regulator PhoU [Methanomicrobiales archaeon]|nr:phosphate uptake regulator PhoU [Methanomicrobiales archaeon]